MISLKYLNGYKYQIFVYLINFFFIFSISSFASDFKINGSNNSILTAKEIATFDYPWAMTFINNSQLLVTTKLGKVWLVEENNRPIEVRGLPTPSVGGQGGLGDIIVHPDYSKNSLIYISLVESEDGDQTRGAAVYKTELKIDDNPTFQNLKIIWRQTPHLEGDGHFSHRMAFGPRGSINENKLFITSGDRRKAYFSRRWDNSLGKVIRLIDNGDIPSDNPFQDKGELAKTFWSTGHRNILGLAFDQSGQLWATEMGPKGGDEFNLIKRGKDYGWPMVSEGTHYDGRHIPNHSDFPKYEPPKLSWNPSIAPAGLTISSFHNFSDESTSAFLTGLRGQAIIEVKVSRNNATVLEKFQWGKRVREVDEGVLGSLWVLEDGKGARLLKLSFLE